MSFFLKVMWTIWSNSEPPNLYDGVGMTPSSLLPRWWSSIFFSHLHWLLPSTRLSRFRETRASDEYMRFVMCKNSPGDPSQLQLTGKQCGWVTTTACLSFLGLPEYQPTYTYCQLWGQGGLFTIVRQSFPLPHRRAIGFKVRGESLAWFLMFVLLLVPWALSVTGVAVTWTMG